MPLYVKLRLREEDFIKDEEIYMGDIPMVTERGSFIINGAERVVVSQLHRSPGICFEKDFHASGKELFAFRIIPDRGTWLEVQFDNNDLLYVYLDRRRRRRKFLITTLLRAIGYSSDLDILNLFYEIKDLKVAKALDMENVSTLVLVEDAIDAQKGVVLARAFEPLTKQIVRTFEKHDIGSIRVIDTAVDDGAIIRALKKDPDPQRGGGAQGNLQAPAPRRAADHRQRQGPAQAPVLRSRSATTSAASAATRSTRSSASRPTSRTASSPPRTSSWRPSTSSASSAATAWSTTSTTSAAAACAPSANCSPTSAAWASPAPSASCASA